MSNYAKIKNYLLRNEDELFYTSLDVASEVEEIMFFPNDIEVMEEMLKEGIVFIPFNYTTNDEWFMFVKGALINSYTTEEILHILQENIDKIVEKLIEIKPELDNWYLNELIMEE